MEELGGVEALFVRHLDALPYLAVVFKEQSGPAITTATAGPA
jgi:hypothetical protein